MGNMIVIAVRHDKVNEWESLSAEEAFRARHQFETVTGKCWDQSTAPTMRHGNSGYV